MKMGTRGPHSPGKMGTPLEKWGSLLSDFRECPVKRHLDLSHHSSIPVYESEVLPSSCDQESDDEDLDQKIQILLASREKAFKKVEANINAAQKRQKETYDRKHQPQVIPEGTEVLLENTYQKQRKGGKMDPLWLGPYTIHKNLGKGLYELKNKEGKLVKKKANINRLKVYTRRNEVPLSSPNNSPNKSPQSSPSKSPQSSPCKSPQSSPSKSPQSSPCKSPQSSPSKSPQSSPCKSPQSSPSKSPQSSPCKSPQSSPCKSPQSSPTKSPPQKRRRVCFVYMCKHYNYVPISIYVHDNCFILNTTRHMWSVCGRGILV